MADEDVIGRLVQLIKGYRCIYDSANSNFYKEQVISNVWLEIAEQLGLSSSDAKAKWKAQKDKFCEKKRIRDEAFRSGVGAGWTPNWDLWDAMAFLEPFVGNRQLTENTLRSNPSPPATGSDESSSQSPDDTQTSTFVPLRDDQLDSPGSSPPTPLRKRVIARPKRKRKSSSSTSADDRARAIIAAIKDVNAIGHQRLPGLPYRYQQYDENPETKELKYLFNTCEYVMTLSKESRHHFRDTISQLLLQYMQNEPLHSANGKTLPSGNVGDGNDSVIADGRVSCREMS